jgi:hypothetical protein
MAKKKATKKLKKGTKMERAKAPTTFKLIPVKSVSWSHE